MVSSCSVCFEILDREMDHFSRIIKGNLKYHLGKDCNSWVDLEQVHNRQMPGEF